MAPASFNQESSSLSGFLGKIKNSPSVPQQVGLQSATILVTFAFKQTQFMLIILTSGLRACVILYSAHILWTETREINTASINEQTLAARAGADLSTDRGTVQQASECSCHLYITNNK